MQTFLPYPDFEESARCLDNKRLGKQRVECLQILNTLYQTQISQYYCKDCDKPIFPEFEGICPFCLTMWKKVSWQNHPAVQMWKGYEDALITYGLVMCAVWVNRGFKDTCADKIENINEDYSIRTKFPDWLGNEEFHRSHRSNLLRKDPIHYGKFGWTESNDLPYYWPTKHLDSLQPKD